MTCIWFICVLHTRVINTEDQRKDCTIHSRLHYFHIFCFCTWPDCHVCSSQIHPPPSWSRPPAPKQLPHTTPPLAPPSFCLPATRNKIKARNHNTHALVHCPWPWPLTPTGRAEDSCLFLQERAHMFRVCWHCSGMSLCVCFYCATCHIIQYRVLLYTLRDYISGHMSVKELEVYSHRMTWLFSFAMSPLNKPCCFNNLWKHLKSNEMSPGQQHQILATRWKNEASSVYR